MKSFSIENIKSFKNNTEIELKPLTILVGRNSCGKSSLLRFPVVLSQTCDDDSQSTLQLYGKMIDYGTFNDVVFDHQGNVISFSLKYDVVVNDDSMMYRKTHSKKETPDIRTVEVATRLSVVKERLVIVNQKLYIDGKCMFEFSFNENKKTYKICGVYDFENGSFTDEEFSMTSDYGRELGFFSFPPVGEDLRECIKQQFFPNEELTYDDERKRFYAEDTLFGETDDEDIKKIRNGIKASTAASVAMAIANPFVFPIAMMSLAKNKERIKKLIDDNSKKDISETEKFRELIEKKTEVKSTETELRFWYINDCYSYYYGLFDTIYQMCRSEMSMLSYIGPFRQSPERIYRDTGSQQKKVGVKGEYASNVLIDDYTKNKTLIDSISEWLNKALGYKLIVSNVADGYFQLLLEDKNGIRSNITDVGYGISQILPIITQIMVTVPDSKSFVMKNNNLISEISIIEQPELHLHPAAQAELADLFVACVNGNDNRKLLIETHSEHFIRKLQVLIADKDCEITADDVAVYYVDKNEKGEAIIDKLIILPNGQFEKDWPSGFFDKAFELSLELIKKNS